MAISYKISSEMSVPLNQVVIFPEVVKQELSYFAMTHTFSASRLLDSRLSKASPKGTS